MCDRRIVSGIWVHWTDRPTEILIRQAGRFDPTKTRNSFVGTALYTVPDGQKWMAKPIPIRFRVSLQPHEVMAEFISASETGITHNHVAWYLNGCGIAADRTPRPGNSLHNLAIQHHFLNIPIRAIRYAENGADVLAIYDPTCAELLP